MLTPEVSRSLCKAEAIVKYWADDAEYDAVDDPEACITAILTALRYWCFMTNHSWEQALQDVDKNFVGMLSH